MIPDPEQRFTGLPVTVEYMDGRDWRLARDCAYRIANGAFAGQRTTARAGFVFDWASIPRVFWRVMPPAGLQDNPYGIAALFHDWIYVHQAIAGEPCSRLEADMIFREIMLYIGVARWRVRIIYRAVRLGGGVAWRYHKNLDSVNSPENARKGPSGCFRVSRYAQGGDRRFARGLQSFARHVRFVTQTQEAA